MADTRWSDTTVTNAGTSLLADYAAGYILTITGAYGSSKSEDDPASLETLPDGLSHPLTIESVTKEDSNVTVCVQVSSLGNAEAYTLQQIGLYAETHDPSGEAGTEQLFAVISDSDGITVPAGTEQLYTFKLYIVISISNSDHLEVSISTTGVATIGTVTEAIAAHNTDPDAHADLFPWSIIVVRERNRVSGKPDYGIPDTGNNTGNTDDATIETGTDVVVDETEYSVSGVSTSADTAEDGTIIVEEV